MISSPAVSDRNSIAIDVPSIFLSASSFIQSKVGNERLRFFLFAALDSLQNETRKEPYVSFIHIPVFIHAAIRGGVLPAHPPAVAATLLFLGIDIMDDLADGDDRPFWAGYNREEINLAAMLLLCSLPQLLIDDFKISLKNKNAMHRTLAESFLKMAHGQQRDLAFTKSTCVTVDEVEKSVIGKSGGEMALFAALAAHYAGAPKKKAGLYAEFGRHLGTAIQFSTDCHDLFEADLSRDLMHGTRTLPIVFHLERKNGGERENFLRMLSEAERDAKSRETLRNKFRADGDLHRSAFVIELYCRRALKALNKARPLEPAKAALKQFINHISLFPKKEGTYELREYRKDRGSVDGRRLISSELEEGSRGGNQSVQGFSN